MNTSLCPRHVRRQLERRADRLLARLRGLPIEADPATSVVLLREGVEPLVLPATFAADVLVTLGLADAWREIVRCRATRGFSLPVVVFVDDVAQVGWLDLQPLALGGVA